MQIKKIMLILIMVGILSTSAPISASSTSPSSSGDNTGYPIMQENLSTLESSVVPDFNDLTQNFVVIAENDASYAKLSQESGIVESFEGLRAIVIETSISNLESLKETSDFTYEYSEVFTRAVRPHFELNKEQNSALQLDELIDAELLKADDMWNNGYLGQNVTVAVFDNGVDFSHQALKTGVFEKNYNVEEGIAYPIVEDHGTFVAGMIAANGTASGHPETMGTAPGADLGSINIGTHPSGFLAGDLLSPWDWMVKNNESIDIVNTSWGGGATIWDTVVDRLEDVNILVVGAAGNSGPSTETVGGPANAIAALAVGATTQEGVLSSFSSRGYGNQLTIKPDVVGPGEAVGSIFPGNEYGSGSGTSFASPAVAGAAAVLISALEQNNIDWNVGLIKAALMRGADSISSERNSGKGMVNVVKAWNYIQSLEKDGNLPLAIELTPSAGPVSYLRTLPQDVQVDLTMTLITSDPSQVEMNLTGDIANFAELGIIAPDKQSQVITLSVDTTGLANGRYAGEISAGIGNDNVTSIWTIDIVDAPDVRGAMDVYHPGGNVILSFGVGSSSTGDLIQNALSRGIWIENLNEPATTTVLEQYDFYWTTGDGVEASPGFEAFSTSNVITQDEMDAISSYVENGGDIILTIDGKFGLDLGTEIWDVGTNTEVYNYLLAKFGMKASDSRELIPYPPSFGSGKTTTTEMEDIGSLTEGIEYITHDGNYLEIIADSQVEVVGRNRFDENKISMATYSSEGGGRAFVASSTTFHINSLYTNADNEKDDRLFTNNLIDWISTKNKINKLDSSYNEGIITGRLQLWDDIQPGSGATATLQETVFVDEASIDLIDEGNGIFSFEVDATEDGLYNIIVEYESNYIKYSYLTDTTPPTIEPIGLEQDQVFEPDETISLAFKVDDLLYDMNKLDLSLNLNGEEVPITNFNYFNDTQELRYVIFGSDAEARDTPYILSINATDGTGNSEVYDYTFWVGDGPPTEEEANLPSMAFVLSVLMLIPILRKSRS